MAAETPYIYLKDYRPTPFAITGIELVVDLWPQATKVVAKTGFAPREGQPATRVIKLDGEALSLKSISIDGKGLSENDYELVEDGIILKAVPNAPFTLETEVIINPEANKSLMGLFLTNGAYCTQCEADGFRRLTYFYDRPDVLTTYRVRIEGDETTEPSLLSNGNLVEEGKLEGGRHYAVWEDPHPKPAYLFALVAGSFDRLEDQFTTSEGREVTLHIYVEPGKKKYASYAMDALKRSMKWDEERFGRAYDLDIFQIVAVSHFNMGAMENKGLNVFNDKYVLADPETATDTDYANIEAIIAHEYFHNWTGNRITCRDWFQLCLKEGLTVFRDQEFSSDMRDRAVQRIEDVRGLRAAQFTEDAGPLAHPVRPEKYREINNFYTSTVYEKGAEVVRMLGTLLGDEGFRKGMDLYFDRHDGDAATIEDFLKCFEDANSVDLQQFYLWYRQAGTPTLTITKEKVENGLKLAFKQSLPKTPDGDEKKPQVLPIKLSLLGHNGEEIDLGLKDDLFVLDQFENDLTVEGADASAVVSALHGFSAPVILKDGQSIDDRLTTLAHDKDGFQRWQAAQTLSQFFIEKRLESDPQDESAFHASMKDIVRTPSLTPAFRAHMLQTPSEQDIARDLGANVDPQAVHEVRESFTLSLAQSLEDGLKEVLAEIGEIGPFEPDAKGAGKRQLKLGAMGLLSKADVSILPMVSKLYETTDNMTERFGALSILLARGAKDAGEKLSDFKNRFEDNPIVMDKWMALQAMQATDNTLANIKKLMGHKTFKLDNPNRVRALIGTFVFANPSQFHAKDGSGYEFAATQILAIDGFNPQLAARLATAFGSWRRTTKTHQEAAQNALNWLKTHTLSRDLSDIVGRTLEG